MVEPFTAIGLLAAKHGVAVLVGALAGDDRAGGVAGELFAALSASESRVDERLASIEAQLVEVVEQAYVVALRSGTRYLFEAGLAGDPTQRAADLERARAQLVQAASAARSLLQQASAERYLLLVSIATGRTAAAVGALPRLEATLLEAALLAKSQWMRPAETVAGRSGGRLGAGLFSRADRAVQVQSAANHALQGLRMIARMLSEVAVLAQVLGLSVRLDPFADPAGWQQSRTLAGIWDMEVPWDGGRVGNIGCRFRFKGGDFRSRIGPLKLQSHVISAELTFEPPLRRAVVLRTRMVQGPLRARLLAAGRAEVEVPFDGYTDDLAQRAQRLEIWPDEHAGALLTFRPQLFEDWRPGMWKTGDLQPS